MCRDPFHESAEPVRKEVERCTVPRQGGTAFGGWCVEFGHVHGRGPRVQGRLSHREPEINLSGSAGAVRGDEHLKHVAPTEKTPPARRTPAAGCEPNELI